MIVIGAGGHALDVLDVILESEVDEEIFFYDDINVSTCSLHNCKVLNSPEAVKKVFPGKFRFVLGTGDAAVRKFLFNKFIRLGGEYVPLRSSGSVFSPFASDASFDVMKNCFIGSGTVIGQGCLINTGAQIHHGVKIGEFSEISPRAIILGNVTIGANCSVGAGATILPKISIGCDTTIGAGAVVTKNIACDALAFGNPAKIITPSTSYGVA